jgi:hypothetical protein
MEKRMIQFPNYLHISYIDSTLVAHKRKIGVYHSLTLLFDLSLPLFNAVIFIDLGILLDFLYISFNAQIPIKEFLDFPPLDRFIEYKFKFILLQSTVAEVKLSIVRPGLGWGKEGIDADS